jgi:hypothetical protein
MKDAWGTGIWLLLLYMLVGAAPIPPTPIPIPIPGPAPRAGVPPSVPHERDPVIGAGVTGPGEGPLGTVPTLRREEALDDCGSLILLLLLSAVPKEERKSSMFKAEEDEGAV